MLKKDQKIFLNDLFLSQNINLNSDQIIDKYKDTFYKKLIFLCLNEEIYQLFPYSRSENDPQKTFEELVNSINNLNTRLLNLKKINKSLDSFANNSNLLNWQEFEKLSYDYISELE